MENNLDLNRIGQREPYLIPADFFEDIEEKILERTVSIQRRKSIFRRVVLTSAASAAMLIAIFLSADFGKVTGESDFGEIEDVFAELSASDRDCILDNFQDDIFINYQ